MLITNYLKLRIGRCTKTTEKRWARIAHWKRPRRHILRGSGFLCIQLPLRHVRLTFSNNRKGIDSTLFCLTTWSWIRLKCPCNDWNVWHRALNSNNLLWGENSWHWQAERRVFLLIVVVWGWVQISCRIFDLFSLLRSAVEFEKIALLINEDSHNVTIEQSMRFNSPPYLQLLKL